MIVSLAAANHDPDVFDEPDLLDITRNPNPHLALSHGIHFCLGASLARLEGQLAVAALLERYPQLEVSGPVIRAGNPMFRTLRHVPVRVHR